MGERSACNFFRLNSLTSSSWNQTSTPMIEDSSQKRITCESIGRGVFPVRWDDPDIGIKWPVNNPILSAKDGAASYLRDVHEQLPTFVPRAR
jgi:dTDP-4-dehydrorhamnose 3,5-epimerase